MTTFRVLLVEDFPTWQKILKDDVQEALDEAGHAGNIWTVGTYDEARALLEKEQWHLLITDIGLGSPSESLQKLGIRLVRLAQAQQVPAIAVSGTLHLSPQDVRTLLREAGAADFFSKQRFDDTEFIKAVQKLLQEADRKASQSTFLEDAVIKILILAANTKYTLRSHLDQEVRDISEGLRRTQKRQKFSLEQRWAVRTRDVWQAMLDIKPHIVHFCGNGDEAGLEFENEAGLIESISSSLSGLFKLFADDVKCVVLNGCYSITQAQAIAQHIPCVIGASQILGDQNLIEFAVGFYDALGAGRSIEFAHEFGCNAIQLRENEQQLLPQLIKLKMADAHDGT